MTVPARRLRTAVAALCLLTAAACGDKGGSMDATGSIVNFAQGHRKPAPPITLPTIRHTKGDTFTLAAHKGHVVVLNYWASWCDACMTEQPYLDSLYDDFHDSVTFMGIDFHGDGSTDSSAKAFLVGHQVPYDSMFDPNSTTVLAFRGKVTVAAPPITVVIDKQGNVAAVVDGVVDVMSMHETLTKLNAESGT